MSQEPSARPRGEIIEPMPTRPSTHRTRAAGLIGVHILAAVHVYWWWSRGVAPSPVEPSEAMAFVTDGVINAGDVPGSCSDCAAAGGRMRVR